jgi:hypothetical protein
MFFYIYLLGVLSVCNAETVLWDGGHGSFFKTEDYSLSGNYVKLTEFMKDHGFALTEIKLPFNKDNLGNARVLVLTINAKEAYSKTEVESIISFVRGGGGVLALCDAKNFDHSRINSVLEPFGMVCGKGVEIQQVGLTKVTISSDSIFNGISEISFKWVGQVKIRDKTGAHVVESSIDDKPIDIISVAEIEKGRVVAIGDMNIFADSLFPKNPENQKLALAVFKWLSSNNEANGATDEPRNETSKREKVGKVAEGDCKEEQIDKELEQSKTLIDKVKESINSGISKSQCQQSLEFSSKLEEAKERLEKFKQACTDQLEIWQKKLKPLQEMRASYDQCVQKKYSHPSSSNSKPLNETPSSLDILKRLIVGATTKPHADSKNRGDSVECNEFGDEYMAEMLQDIRSKYNRINAIIEEKIETGTWFYDRREPNLESASLNEVKIRLKEILKRINVCERL